MAEAMKLQKMKLMAMNTLQGNGSQNGTESEPDDLNSNTGGSESSWDKDKMQSPFAAPAPQHGIAHAALAGQPGVGGAPTLNPLQQNHLLTNRLDLPFMMMPHPLLPVSLPPASVAMAMNQMNHLNTIANMAAAAQIHSPLSRAGTSVIKNSGDNTEEAYQLNMKYQDEYMNKISSIQINFQATLQQQNAIKSLRTSLID
ncbi:hypothetical protein H8958_019692 [Nasalis larvatus]